LAAEGARIHVLYLAVDGFHHYGLEQDTTFEARVAEIERVLALFPGATYEIAYPGQDLIEKLDSLPQRDLVDRFEHALDEHEPELLLIPAAPDYDQDHTAVFHAAVAAARPIARQFGKHLVPEVLTYEMAKIQWASEPLPRFAAFCDITDVIETKLESIRRYETMLRPSPHIRSLEGVRGLATVRGAEIGVAYAEAFGVLRTTLG
jgi:LmbE family N-acetylglucosaminyl deacetylase